MRWDNLFNDLSGQLEHELNAEDVDLRAEEERLRLGRLSLRARLSSLARAESGATRGVVRLVLLSGQVVLVRPETFGRDWLAGDLLGAQPHGGSTPTGASAQTGAPAPTGGVRSSQGIIPLGAIASVVLSSPQVLGSLASEPESSARLTDRIGLSFVLRDLCRRRQQIDIDTAQGMLTGTIDRVGRDHLDLALHERGSARRAGEVREYRLLPFSQIHLVRFGS